MSGDGRLSSNRTSFVLITMTIMLEGNYYSPDDCICVAVYEGKESRDKLEEIFPKVMEEIKELHQNGVNRGGNLIKVNFVFSSDWKFLAVDRNKECQW